MSDNQPSQILARRQHAIRQWRRRIYVAADGIPVGDPDYLDEGSQEQLAQCLSPQRRSYQPVMITLAIPGDTDLREALADNSKPGVVIYRRMVTHCGASQLLQTG